MFRNTYALWHEVAALGTRAARLAGDPSAPWPVRGRAAALCHTLSREVSTDEALCSEVMRAAFAGVETFPVVHDLLLAALNLAPDPSRLVVPIRRFGDAAHRAGHHGAVVVALLELVELDDFDGDVPAAWLIAARSVDGEADYWLRRLVRRWVELRGAEHEGVRAVIRDRADRWFPTRQFRIDVLRAMHTAEPTPAGWIALARRRGEMGNGPLGIAFGDHLGEALVTLREALLRALAERAGIDEKHYQSIESGQSNVTYATLIAMSKALDVTLSELFEGV